MKLPAFMFYPGDWLKDPNLRRCSLAARGMWVDLMCLMFECEERGVLATAGQPWSDDEIAQAVGGDRDVALSCLRELVGKGVAGRNQSGSVYCRRMVRDEEKRKAAANRQKKCRQSRARHGPVTPIESESESETSDGKGGAGERAAVELPPGFPKTVDDAVKQAEFVGCGALFATTTWNMAMSRNGCDARGQPIRSFRHHLAAMWAYDQSRAGEKKALAEGTGRPMNGADTVKLNGEYDRILKRMDVIRSQYESHQTWAADDKAEFQKLKARKKELQAILGITV